MTFGKDLHPNIGTTKIQPPLMVLAKQLYTKELVDAAQDFKDFF